MMFFNLGSIRSKLTLLVFFAILPALVILFYSGLEQRRLSVESARQDVLLLTHSMVVTQKEITRSAERILSTLALLPAIQNLETEASSEIFDEVIKRNPKYNNISLIDLNGNVLASGRIFNGANLSDRKHVQETLKSGRFAVGEYIITRVGVSVPAFPFAYPVVDKEGNPKAVLTTVIKLDNFSKFYDLSNLPEKSFVALTDHRGIRLFYYPSQDTTNPVGKPIKASSWNIANTSKEHGIFTSTGSDGLRRIFAFEQVRFTPEDAPYLYVWAGIPEAYILATANAALKRNLFLMLLATAISLFVSWVICQKTLISPIQSLAALTRKFTKGDLEARGEITAYAGELDVLAKSFNEMADSLGQNQKKLIENEKRFRLLLDSLDAFVYVADMDTYEVLFINEFAKKHLGDVTGKKCWQSIQTGQDGPCPFCTNKYLLTEKGNPGESYSWEFQNTITRQWLYMHDRAIEWTDGRIVRLQIATDISKRKKVEEERNELITELEEALAEIRTLSGFLPICAACKMIRDDKGYWSQIEAYISDHSEAKFSHGICPDCAKKLYPEYIDKMGNFDPNKTYNH